MTATNWAATARKDFRDSVRSRSLWVLVLAFAAILSLIAYFARDLPQATADEFVHVSATVFAFVLPLLALALGYKTVIHERESGTIVLALSLPASRAGFFAGKFVGRSLVLAIPILLGLLVSGGALVLFFDSLPLLDYTRFAGASLLYAGAFLAIAMALSTTLDAGRAVTAGAFVVYLLLVVGWTSFVDAVILILWRFDPTVLTNPPDWVYAAKLASPAEAYGRLVTARFESDMGALYVGPETPWYVDAWVAALVLPAWILLALGVGYLRFREIDL